MIVDDPSTVTVKTKDPVTPGYDRALAPYPYDPTKAKQMLAGAGYASGFDVTLTVPAGVQGAQIA